MKFRALLFLVITLVSAQQPAVPLQDPCYPKTEYIRGPCFSDFWAEKLAEFQPLLEPHRVAYNMSSHVWHWDDAPTCIGWGFADEACNSSTRVCAAAALSPPNATYGFGVLQLGALATMVSRGLTVHPDCPIQVQPEPCMCSREWAPVCGTSNTTFGNACEASCANEEVMCRGECPCGGHIPSPSIDAVIVPAAVCADPHDFSPEIYVKASCEGLSSAEDCESIPLFKWDEAAQRCEMDAWGMGGATQETLDKCVAMGGAPTELGTCREHGAYYVDLLDSEGIDARNASMCPEVFALLSGDVASAAWWMSHVQAACCGGLSYGRCGRGQMVCEDDADFAGDMLLGAVCGGVDAPTCDDDDALPSFEWETDDVNVAAEGGECRMKTPLSESGARQECESAGGELFDSTTCELYNGYLGFEANRAGLPAIRPNRDDGTCDSFFGLEILQGLSRDIFEMFFGHVCCHDEHTICSEGHGDEDVVTVCEGDDVVLECPDHLAVHVVHTFYGRRNNSICPIFDWDDEPCEATSALAAARYRCHGRSECVLVADDVHLGGSPCPWTAKYLQVAHDCVERPSAAPTQAPPAAVPTPGGVPAPFHAVPIPVPAPFHVVPVPVPAPFHVVPVPVPAPFHIVPVPVPAPFHVVPVPVPAPFLTIPVPAPVPAAPTTSQAASLPSPTPFPVPDPTRFPVPAPMNAPVPSPTNASVPAPMNAVVPAPTNAPVPAPMHVPSNAPTRAPAPAPTQSSTDEPTTPTGVPTLAPSDCQCQWELDHLQSQIDALAERLAEAEGRRGDYERPAVGNP